MILLTSVPEFCLEWILMRQVHVERGRSQQINFREGGTLEKKPQEEPLTERRKEA
jgi:hypothetical protein